MRILHAGEEINRASGEKVIALLGPVPRSEETSHLYWQASAISALHKLGYDGLVLVPVRRGQTYYNMAEVKDEDYMTREMQWNGQMFETVEQASHNGLFTFWIPRNHFMQAKYTEQEFYDLVPKHPQQVVMGIPTGAENVTDLLSFCRDKNLTVHEEFFEWAKAIVEKFS